MKHILWKSLATSGLLLFAMQAGAQDRDRDRDDDSYHQAERNDAWWHGHLFQRVREDLAHVQAVTRFSEDQYRLSKVEQELDELQARYESRGYDQPALEDVIGALSRVVVDNHLQSRDRDMLSDDLSRLRAFREHHEGYR